MKISIYGHLIVDKIINEFNNYETLGGIANVWDSLNRISNKNEIYLIPCSIGDAIVLVDTEKNTRVGRANFNRISKKPNIINSDWSHIAYLNQLIDKEFIYDIKEGYVSADLSKENPEISINYLSQIDFLFCSKEDLFMDISELAKKTRGWVISHDPEGSISSNGTEVFEYKIPKKYKLNNVNVLGAGDMFAACFINNMLSKKTIKDSIKKSHIQTSNLLKLKNL
jgi:hypothetical protein